MPSKAALHWQALHSHPGVALSGCARPSQARASATKEWTPVEYSTQQQDPAMLDLPVGYHWYETMMVLRPTLNDEER
jgi:hypothetical protein